MFSLCVPSVFFFFLSKRKSFFKANFGYQRDLEVVPFKEFFFLFIISFSLKKRILALLNRRRRGNRVDRYWLIVLYTLMGGTSWERSPFFSIRSFLYNPSNLLCQSNQTVKSLIYIYIVIVFNGDLLFSFEFLKKKSIFDIYQNGIPNVFLDIFNFLNLLSVVVGSNT